MVTRTYKTVFWAVAMLLIASSVLFVSMSAAQDSVLCPSGQGYWKNHGEAWPVTDLMLGSQMYTQAELIAILNTEPAGDASLILAHQLIAAKLNIATGADSTAISGMVAQGDALLAAFEGKLPYGIAPSATEGAALVTLSGVLDVYNNGGLTVGCEDNESSGSVESTETPAPEATDEATPEVTPEATDEPDDDGDVIIVIEGPVEEININIITIFGIEIELDPEDPVLTVIQIGDVIRVEGDLEHEGDTIVIVAITVIFIDVDVFVVDGQIWRDPGNCDNPPPPWAPAHGWHRRCDVIIIGGDDGSGSGMGMGMGGSGS